MRNYLSRNNLRSVSTRRTGFSLAELVVSIGILVLMFSLAGTVFNITISSTGQATALTEVSQLIRIFEQTIREDLRHVQPGRSLIMIQGNPVNAYWTADGREADVEDGDPSNGYPHQADPVREVDKDPSDPVGDGPRKLVLPRADMLMFFTARRGQSFIYPGVTSRLQQVVYGHAEIGDYELDPPMPPNPPTYSFVLPEPDRSAFRSDNGRVGYPSSTLVSQVVASQWHLARRSVLLSPTSSPPAPSGTMVTPWVVADPMEKDAFGLASKRIIGGDRDFTDVVANFNYDELVLTPGPLNAYKDHHFLPAIFVHGINGMTPYDATKIPFRRSQLDPTPPPQNAGNLAHYFMPACASFKVEWTLDPRSEVVAGNLDSEREVFWFDPGIVPNGRTGIMAKHPMQSLEIASAVAKDNDLKDLRWERLDSLLTKPTFHPDGDFPGANPSLPPGERYSLAERMLGSDSASVKSSTSNWPTLATDGRPNLVVFGAARRKLAGSTAGEIVPEDIFPSALRITIDMYDPGQRLKKPIRHVMVVPVGG